MVEERACTGSEVYKGCDPFSVRLLCFGRTELTVSFFPEKDCEHQKDGKTAPNSSTNHAELAFSEVIGPKNFCKKTLWLI